MTEDNDIELFLKVIEADEKAFNTLYKRHKDFVRRIIKRRCYNWTTDFDDITQKAWLKLFRTKKHYTEMSFKSFLVMICISVCNDEYEKTISRGGMNTKLISIDETFSEDTIDSDVPKPRRPDEELENEMGFMLSQLSEEQRDVFILKIEGMRNKEIAQALELKEYQVKYLLKLARDELAKPLLATLGDEKREVFILKIKGMDEKGIAHKLDLTEDQVKNILKLARNQLTNYLQDQPL